MIPAALMFYDTNNHQYEKDFKKVKQTHMALSRNDVDPSTIELYDKNNNMLRRCTFQILGRYEKQTQQFQWSWGITMLPKHLTKITRRLFNYGTNILLEHTYVQKTLENPALVRSIFKDKKIDPYDYKLEEPIQDGVQSNIANTVKYSKVNEHVTQSKLKEQLINSSVYISHLAQLDVLLALSMYLSKNTQLFKFTYDNNIFWYVVLLNDLDVSRQVNEIN